MRVNIAFSTKSIAGLALLAAMICAPLEFATAQRTGQDARFRLDTQAQQIQTNNRIEQPEFEDQTPARFFPQVSSARPLNQTAPVSPRHIGAFDNHSVKAFNHGVTRSFPSEPEVSHNRSNGRIRVASAVTEHHNPTMNNSSLNTRSEFVLPSPQTSGGFPFKDQYQAFPYRPMQATPPAPTVFTFQQDCCDEWEGFCNCGGLKVNPGHYARKYWFGNDACEEEQCRPRKDRSCGCSSCDDSSTGFSFSSLVPHFGISKIAD